MGGNLKMKNDIQKIFTHPELINDIASIAQTMTQAQFNEFFDCYQDTVEKCMENPFSDYSEELKFKLSGCTADF